MYLLKGAMQAHQVLSKESLNVLEFRSLSYFDNKENEHHHVTGTLNYGCLDSAPGPDQMK